MPQSHETNSVTSVHTLGLVIISKQPTCGHFNEAHWETIPPSLESLVLETATLQF